MFIKHESESFSDDQKKGLQMISNSGKRLLTLVNRTLDLSKIEAGKLKIILKPILINQLINFLGNYFYQTVNLII